VSDCSPVFGLIAALARPMPSWGSCGRTQRSERGTELAGEERRLLPRREMAALVELVEIDELVIRPLRPTSLRLIILAGKDAYGGWDGDVGGVVKVDDLQKLRRQIHG